MHNTTTTTSIVFITSTVRSYVRLTLYLLQSQQFAVPLTSSLSVTE